MEPIKLTKSMDLDDLDNLKGRNLIVTLFFGLPGLGKTTLYDELTRLTDETNIKLSYISEDEIWRDLMEK